MMATSHEYKTPAIDAALALVQNYKWELTTAKTKNLQGINKPVNRKKVESMAKDFGKAKDKVAPFIVVDKLHGIRPQTRGKRILLDGHHRLHACEAIGMEEVPVYLGTFTGGAQLPKEVLREEVPNEKTAEDFSYGKRNNLHVDKIRASADNSKMVWIKYQDSKGEITERQVEPYKLDLRTNDFWAFDPAKDSIRRFKLKSIKSLKNTKNSFDSRWPNETWDATSTQLEKKCHGHKGQKAFRQKVANSMEEIPLNSFKKSPLRIL